MIRNILCNSTSHKILLLINLNKFYEIWSLITAYNISREKYLHIINLIIIYNVVINKNYIPICSTQHRHVEFEIIFTANFLRLLVWLLAPVTTERLRTIPIFVPISDFTWHRHHGSIVPLYPARISLSGQIVCVTDAWNARKFLNVI